MTHAYPPSRNIDRCMGMCGSTDLDTGETHEGHGEETGADHCDRHTTHCLGDGCPCELLADTGKDGDSHSETDCSCESIDDALAEIHVLLHDRDGHTENGTVSGDEREEYTERAVEHGGNLLDGIVNFSIIGTKRFPKIIAKETPSALAPKRRNNPVRIPNRIPNTIFPIGVIGEVT